MKKVEKTEQEWKAQLNDLEYYVLRQAGTERPFTGEYYKHEEKGVYSCKACGHDLFESTHKFHSGCGWPSFWGELESAEITQKVDYSHGMNRIELLCSNCNSHLGHIFNDGPKKLGGMRYCINSVCLDFRPKEK
ncbi:MAG: peptide-methionine (R)-S-oxide reductase MsrB [Saprospiraceae bacterium]|nr:peptide-methionine (R)-S-oxide reductase MsrB [Saprospiraceae bacterium]